MIMDYVKKNDKIKKIMNKSKVSILHPPQLVREEIKNKTTTKTTLKYKEFKKLSTNLTQLKF